MYSCRADRMWIFKRKVAKSNGMVCCLGLCKVFLLLYIWAIEYSKRTLYSEWDSWRMWTWTWTWTRTWVMEMDIMTEHGRGLLDMCLLSKHCMALNHYYFFARISNCCIIIKNGNFLVVIIFKILRFQSAVKLQQWCPFMQNCTVFFLKYYDTRIV